MTPGTLAENLTLFLLLTGLSLAGLFFVLGLLIRKDRFHNLIAGYNTASPEVRKQYDIEGLAEHLGSGLKTIGVLLAAAAITADVGLSGWSMGIMAVFVLICFIMVIGGQKFTPAVRNLPPADARHWFLKRIVPERAFRAIEAGTRQWNIECPCGLVRDYWEAGGVRYKAVGEPRQWGLCPACNRARWHKARRKTQLELLQQ